MTDIKETIQGLYTLKTYLASKAIEEHGVARESLIGMQNVVDSAVNLLKKQEAKSPVAREKNGWWDRVCPTCGSRDEELFYEWNYCPFCGQAVKWDD